MLKDEGAATTLNATAGTGVGSGQNNDGPAKCPAGAARRAATGAGAPPSFGPFPFFGLLR